MMKKITVFLFVFTIHFSFAQLNWNAKNSFEQKNFIESKGQFQDVKLPNHEAVLYSAKIDGVIWYFTKSGFTIKRIENIRNKNKEEEKDLKRDDDEMTRYTRSEKYQETRFEDANSNVDVVSENKVSNYYSYGGPALLDGKGTIKANAYKRIVYKNIYPNTDIVFQFPKDSTGIEYSFILHPGSDAANIKIKFPRNNNLELVNNAIETMSDFGLIITHAPVSFMQGSKSIIKSNFTKNGNVINIETGIYDKSKTLIIDPWVVTPSFAGNNGAFDVDYDLAGNVYAYGGIGPYELLKFNSSGVLQWTFTGAFTGTYYYYGDFAVDRNTANIYLTEGFNSGAGAGVIKISAAATVLVTFPGNSQYNEMWRIAFSRCTPNAVIAGGGVSSPTYQTCYLDTTLLGITMVQYVPTANCCHDVGQLALDNYGNTYQITNYHVGDPIYNNVMVKLPLPAMIPTTWNVPANYAFQEVASATYYTTAGATIANGYNGLTTSGTLVYTYDGYVLKKWDGPTGNLLAYDRISWPPGGDSVHMSWGGISADDCGNLFLGDNMNVRQYDANLSLVNSYPMTNLITDVNIANSGVLYVSGIGYVASVTPNNIVNCQNSGVLSLTATSVPANCNTPGSATAIVTGGNPPYNIVWNTIPPQTGLTITNVPAGTYTATIIDGGCNQQTFIDSVVVGSTGGVTATSSTTIATCGNNNGTATVTPTSGVAPYTYLWTGGQTTQTATGLAVGTYTCTIHDNNGCVTTQVVNITSNNAVTATYTSTPTGCTTSIGTATVTATGGNAPYTYLWSNGQTTQTGTGLPNGSSSCVITDNVGCSQLLYVNITSSNPLTLSISSTPTGCTTSIGTATAIPGNGALPYVYNWSNGQTGITATALGLGPISCTITDNNGCTYTQSTTISSNNPITSTETHTQTGCTVNNGTATVTPGNGALPYIYSWSNGQNSQTASGLAVGTYTCTITDANGCTHNQTATITSTNTVTLSLSSTITGCTVNNGTATATALNGVSPFTYLWTGGQTTVTATGLAAGTYICTATDANGCGRTDSVVVASQNNVTLALSSTQTNCIANNGTATAVPANGTLPFTYSWSNGQTVATAIGLGAATYTCTATDALGCAHTDTVVVTSNNPVTLSLSNTQTICTAFTGTATASPANGATPYSYLWSNGQTSQTATALSTGGYVCIVTDANGCTQTQNVMITQTSPPIAIALPSYSSVVSGESVILSASGGTNYQWSPSDGLSCDTCATLVCIPPKTATYCVLVTDGNGCTDSTCIEVHVRCNSGILNLLVPSAFSPNNDGMNDELCIPENVCILDFELDIFDRWGEKVFVTTSLNNCWDGTYKGAALGTSAYVFTFTAKLSSGGEFNQKGTISLIK